MIHPNCLSPRPKKNLGMEVSSDLGDISDIELIDGVDIQTVLANASFTLSTRGPDVKFNSPLPSIPLGAKSSSGQL